MFVGIYVYKRATFQNCLDKFVLPMFVASGHIFKLWQELHYVALFVGWLVGWSVKKNGKLIHTRGGGRHLSMECDSVQKINGSRKIWVQKKMLVPKKV